MTTISTKKEVKFFKFVPIQNTVLISAYEMTVRITRNDKEPTEHTITDQMSYGAPTADSMTKAKRNTMPRVT